MSDASRGSTATPNSPTRAGQIDNKMTAAVASPKHVTTEDELSARSYELSPPRITPENDEIKYWSRQALDGFIINLYDTNDTPCRVNWRFEWLRGSQTSGCKFEGYWSSTQLGQSDWVSSFRLAPHRFGFVNRKAKQEPTIELLLPGKYLMTAWCSNGKGMESAVIHRTFTIKHAETGDERENK